MQKQIVNSIAHFGALIGNNTAELKISPNGMAKETNNLSLRCSVAKGECTHLRKRRDPDANARKKNRYAGLKII